jgi:hypothetical protein
VVTAEAVELPLEIELPLLSAGNCASSLQVCRSCHRLCREDPTDAQPPELAAREIL